MQRKSSKPQPRPVTAWCGWSRWKGNTWLTFASGVSIVRENIGLDGKADASGVVKVRITPIRKPTDAELRKLAKAIYEDSAKEARGRGVKPIEPFDRLCAEFQQRWLSAARAAWKKGARP